MEFVRRIIALAVLALWLPATLHCALEAAGFTTASCCAAEDSAPASGTCDDSGRDACDIVEGADFRPAHDSVALAAPARCTWLLPAVEPPTVEFAPPPSLREDTAPPPELTSRWHFIARAAAPPRAPSLAS